MQFGTILVWVVPILVQANLILVERVPNVELHLLIFENLQKKLMGEPWLNLSATTEGGILQRM